MRYTQTQYPVSWDSSPYNVMVSWFPSDGTAECDWGQQKKEKYSVCSNYSHYSAGIREYVV